MDHVNERLARLKHLLGIVEEEQDGLLSTALQAVEDQVLNYLGREELPPELERALLLYQGRGVLDSRGGLPREQLEGLASRYGALIY